MTGGGRLEYALAREANPARCVWTCRNRKIEPEVHPSGGFDGTGGKREDRALVRPIGRERRGKPLICHKGRRKGTSSYELRQVGMTEQGHKSKAVV